MLKISPLLPILCLLHFFYTGSVIAAAPPWPGGDSVALHFNGIYNMLDTTTMLPSGERSDIYSKPNNFTVFGAKKMAYKVDGATLYYAFTCAFYKKYAKEQYLGSFVIKGDSVYATMPTTVVLWGMRYKSFPVSFRGYIKNADTIQDWKMIPPYPVRLSKFVRKLNQNLVQPQLLYFIPTDAVFCIEPKKK